MADTSSVKYKFISDLQEELKCGICDQAATAPLQHGSCGRIFCKKCLETYVKGKLCPPCPFCFQTYPVFFSDMRGEVLRNIARLAKIFELPGIFCCVL